MSKCLLVTGGAGFIGSEFVRQGLAADHRVVVLDALTYAGHPANLREVDGEPGYRFVHGRIEDPVLVPRLLAEIRPDAIVNFAAESHVDRSISDPGSFITTNIQGVFNLLRASLAYIESRATPGFRFVQISTDEVFGELGASGHFTETSPYAPSSPYSASKASADHLVKAWHRTYGLPTIITYGSNTYGPRQFPEKLIPLMIVHALEGKPLPIYGTGRNVRDWIHVEDHCRGVMLALERGKPGSAYAFGGGAERTNLQVVDAICGILDELRPRADGQSHKELKTFVADRKGHDFRYAIDDSLARRELGFERRHGFEQGLRETVLWYLENGGWLEAVRGSRSQPASSR